MGKYMTQEKTNRNYKDSVFVDFLCRFSQKIEKKNRLHEWQMSTQCVRMEYFRQEIPKANVNINARTPHSLDVFLRKHFVRLHCKLTHSSCYRFVFDSIFPAEIFHSCTTYIHRVCKPKPVLIAKKEKYPLKPRCSLNNKNALCKLCLRIKPQTCKGL